MEFPAIDLTNTDWGFSVNVPIHFDQYVYVRNSSRFLSRQFCDSVGHVYEVIDVIKPKTFLKSFVAVLPNTYRSELVFRRVDKELSVDDLRSFMLSCLKLTGNDKAYSYFGDELQLARSCFELLGGNNNP